MHVTCLPGSSIFSRNVEKLGGAQGRGNPAPTVPKVRKGLGKSVALLCPHIVWAFRLLEASHMTLMEHKRAQEG